MGFQDNDIEIEIEDDMIEASVEMNESIVIDNYNSLKNKPSINNVELSGNKTLDELGIQEKGDFATKDYVEQEIANFDFIKIVTELPETGLVNRTYFVPKTDTENNDLYDEYMWVDNKWELLGTKQIEVDLTDYVKNTDYATNGKGGVIKSGNGVGLTDGVIKTNILNYSEYQSYNNNLFIGKGTLENVIEGKELTNKPYVDEKNAEQDKNINDESNRISRDINNITSSVLGDGENVTLNDTANATFKKLKVSGNSEQETREGYNIVNVEALGVDSSYFSITNGVFANKYTDSKTFFQFQARFYDSSNNYVDSTGLTDINSTGIFRKAITVPNDSSISYMTIKHNGSTQDLTTNKLIEVTPNEELVIYMNVLGIDPTVVGGISFKDLMIYKGTDLTKTYEPYGASPSPEFESSIRNVGDIVNLLDYKKFINTGIVNDNGTIGTDTTRLWSEKIKVKPNETIYFKTTAISSNNEAICLNRIIEFDNNGNFLRRNINYGLKTDFAYIVPNDVYYIILDLRTQALTTILNNTDLKGNTQLNKGIASYSPYNCGSANITVCNENLFDEITELGTINATTGGNISYSDGIRGKNYCKCKPNTTYYVYCGTTVNSLGLVFYDNNKTFITTKYGVNATITAPINAKYFRIRLDGYGTAYNNDILVAEGSIATEYKPHQSQSITFPLSEGQRLYKGSYLADDGIHHKRGQVVFDGSDDENWIYPNVETNTTRWQIALSNCKPGSICLCNQLIEKTMYAVDTIGCDIINTNFYVRFSNDNASTIAKLKAWLSENPITVEYDLAEEVIEPYTEEQQIVYNQIKKAYSYKDVTHIFSTDEISPIFEIEAIKDPQVELEEYVTNEKFNDTVGNIEIVLKNINGEV